MWPVLACMSEQVEQALAGHRRLTPTSICADFDLFDVVTPGSPNLHAVKIGVTIYRVAS